MQEAFTPTWFCRGELRLLSWVIPGRCSLSTTPMALLHPSTNQQSGQTHGYTAGSMVSTYVVDTVHGPWKRVRAMHVQVCPSRCLHVLCPANWQACAAATLSDQHWACEADPCLSSWGACQRCCRRHAGGPSVLQSGKTGPSPAFGRLPGCHANPSHMSAVPVGRWVRVRGRT
jgi:hypothetical protein